jgi:7,8-dihydropterin-6-yl-methyl-4-(beta-D-ribofuranosyl)aminobenzene 5'-phosphate synthase
MSVGKAALICLAILICPIINADEPAANRITVVYNHSQGDAAGELQPGGGFSALVEFNGRVLLFDTGGQTDTLISNLRALEKDLSRIEAVVISHNHWDHVYGLPGVISLTGDRAKIYVPGSSRESILQQNPRGSIIAVEDAIEISPKVWVIGPIKLEYRGTMFEEQALVLDGKDGLIVLVGCSHPGIVEIVGRVRRLFDGKKVRLVGGGFHLRSTSGDEIGQIATKLREAGVERLAPTHCTGESATATLKEQWGENFVTFTLGDTFTF